MVEYIYIYIYLVKDVQHFYVYPCIAISWCIFGGKDYVGKCRPHHPHHIVIVSSLGVSNVFEGRNWTILNKEWEGIKSKLWFQELMALKDMVNFTVWNVRNCNHRICNRVYSPKVLIGSVLLSIITRSLNEVTGPCQSQLWV